MITIPSQQDKKWSQKNSGDIFGNLYSTKNIDFSKEGYVTLSKKVRAFYRAAIAGDFDGVLAIVFSPVGNLVLTDDDIYNINLSDTNSAPLVINSDTGVQTPTVNGDGVAYNGYIYNTGSTATKYWDGANWTSASIVLVSGTPHPMAVFESLNYLAVATDKNIVKLYDTSNSLIQTLTIPKEYQVRWLVYREQNLYIGTRSLVGKDAKMFIWNGSGTAAQRAYSAKGEIMFSGCEYGNSIATVTNLGQVLLFNGGGFTELANFPIYYTTYEWSSSRIHRRGMIADGEDLYINVNGSVSTQNVTVELPNQPSGLWSYDPKVGLYHKASTSTDYPTFASVTAVDTSTDTITLGTSVETQTGEPVTYSQGTSAIGGVTSNRIYYAIRVTGTTFKLAETYNNAIDGVVVNLTTDPGTYTGVLVCPRGSSFGETYTPDATPGAIALIPESETSYNFLSTKVLYGIQTLYLDDLTTQYSTLQTLTPGENRGSIVTQKLFSTNIEDVWNKVIIKAKNLFNSNDKVIVKYRTSEKQFYPITPDTFQLVSTPITWVDGDTFTITSSKWSDVEVGEEIEIVSGAGAGHTAHITAITSSSGTYTVTIDETIPLITAADTSYVVVDNWTKGETLTSSMNSLHDTTSINLKSKWLQIKVELRGEGTQVEELQVISKTHLPSV